MKLNKDREKDIREGVFFMEKTMDANVAMIITGGFTLIGVILTNIFSNKQVARDIKGQIDVSMAVTNTKLEDLTKQVEKHNQVIERTFKLEQAVEDLKHERR